MNILLLDGLPEEYEGIPISPDYRNMIQGELILHDPTLTKKEKTLGVLNQLYPEMPANTNKAIEGFAWFFRRGQEPSKEDGEGKAEKKPFNFEQDASLIYSAFYATYGLSLTTVDFLHWWEFMALFEGLPETTLIQRVIYWRTADLFGLSKKEKKHIQKMRKLFALKAPKSERLSIEEIEQKNKDEIAKRFEDAQRWAAERK